jgi:hypothetical protein
MRRSVRGVARLGAGGVQRSNGVAVHRRSREGWDVGARGDGLGQHASAGAIERHALDARHRRDRALDDLARLVERDGLL